MIIIEYRVPMPFSASEYRIGQLYTIAKKSKLESANSKNGVRININEPYSNGPGGQGQYTSKTYYLADRIPDWMKRLLPESASRLKEEAWNAYPYSKNKFTNPLLDKLNLEIESRYLDGPPILENVFNLDSKEEKLRSIVMIDIANDKYRANRRTDASANCGSGDDDVSSSSSSSFCDQQILNFNPLFRDPINRNWLQEFELARERNCSRANKLQRCLRSLDLTDTYNRRDSASDFGASGMMRKNLMTCYKLCRISFPVWPIQSKVEQFIQQYCRDTIIESHRQTWLWQDEWTGLSLDDIRALERSTQIHLVELMQQASLDC